MVSATFTVASAPLMDTLTQDKSEISASSALVTASASTCFFHFPGFKPYASQAVKISSVVSRSLPST